MSYGGVFKRHLRGQRRQARFGGDIAFHEHQAEDITGGVFGNITVIGDIWSANWNGPIPADLSGGSVVASDGIYIDSSEGSAQFMGDLWLGGNVTLGGDMTLTSGEGSITVAGSGASVVLTTDTTFGEGLYFSSGAYPIGATGYGGRVYFPGGSSDGVTIEGPRRSDLNLLPASLVLKNSTGGDGTIEAICNSLSITGFLSSSVRLPDGSSGSPALSFSNNTNLGLYRVGADQLGVAASALHVGGATFPSVGKIRMSSNSGETPLAIRASSASSTRVFAQFDNSSETVATAQTFSGVFNITGPNEIRLSFPAVRLTGSSQALHTGQDRSSGSGFFHGRNTNPLGDVTVTRHVRVGSAGTAELGYHSSLEEHKDDIHPLADEVDLSIIDKVVERGGLIASDRKPEFAGGNAAVLGMLRDRHARNLADGVDSHTTKDRPVKSRGRNGVLHEWSVGMRALEEVEPQLLTRDGHSPSYMAMISTLWQGLYDARARIKELESAV